jgi:hypothetical protein
MSFRIHTEEEVDTTFANYITTSTTGSPIFIPIGSIVPFALTEGQLLTLSDKFYLCDGRTCANTPYSSITGQLNVPDLRGLFVRGINAPRQIGSIEAQSTRLPTNPIALTLSASGTHAHGTSTTSSAGSHSHTYQTPAAVSSGPYNTAIDLIRPGFAAIYTSSVDGQHTHSALTDPDGIHTHSLAISFSESITRPRNFAVNYFIRVY